MSATPYRVEHGCRVYTVHEGLLDGYSGEDPYAVLQVVPLADVDALQREIARLREQVEALRDLVDGLWSNGIRGMEGVWNTNANGEWTQQLVVRARSCGALD